MKLFYDHEDVNLKCFASLPESFGVGYGEKAFLGKVFHGETDEAVFMREVA